MSQLKSVKLQDIENNELILVKVQEVINNQQTLDDALKGFKNKILNALFPVGIVRIFSNEYNPNTISEDMHWQLFSEGKILYNKNEGDPQPEQCSYYVKMDENTMPTHQHNIFSTRVRSGGSYINDSYWNGGQPTVYSSISQQSGDTAHINVMPYIAYNIWKRVS